MRKYLYFFSISLCYLALNGCAKKPIFIPFNDQHISYEGRIPYTADAAELTWPGTAVRINFTGTSISGWFKDSDTANYYIVLLDNKPVSTLHFEIIKKKYELVAGLPYGNHSLQLYKRTEWDKGKTWFYGFESDEKIELLLPPELPKRKMEFFGNSITVGYAITDSVHDSYVGYFQNCYDAYAAITARHFNAQCYSTSKSGIGITISWFPLIAKEMYDRLDPTDPKSKWDFAAYTPDLVVINLFQNDYWLVNLPEHPEFKNRFGTKAPDSNFIIGEYKNFVQLVRYKYPNAQIICMLGNMNVMQKGSVWPGYVLKAVAALNDPKIFTFFAPYKGTPGHPKLSEQKKLADELIQFIDDNIKW